MKTHTILIFVSGIGLMFGPRALAQFAQNTPPLHQSGGSQSTSRGQTTQSKSTFSQAPSNKSAAARNASTQHQAGRRGYNGPSHGGGVGVGIGATIDLGGIGQRRAEPDLFTLSAERQPVVERQPVTARAEEKPKIPKKPREVAKPDPFAALQLTGPKAKAEATFNPAAMDQTAETNPFASVDLATAKAKDLEKQKRNYDEKQQ